MTQELQSFSAQRSTTSARRWIITPNHLVVDRRGIEPRLPDCKSGVFPLDEQPMLLFHREVCPGIEPGLPAYHAGVLPKHLQTVVLLPGIPDGLEPSLSCMSRRRLRLWTTGSSDPCGSRTRLSSLEGWRLCRSANGTCFFYCSGRRGS